MVHVLINAFAEGSYLETCGYSECTDGSKYNVSTHTQANRDNYGSGTWSFQTLEPPKFQYKVEDSEAGSNFTQNDNPHAWIYTASKNWMGYLPDYIQLKDISIPGTHDSGARYGGLAAECQSWTVTEQLQAGIRYLDIRCRPTGDAFAIHHGAFFQKQMFGDIMNEVTSFLQNNPTEVVTLRLKMEADNNKKNQEDFQKIWNSYANRYQDYLYKGTDPDLTLGEARGKIYVMCDAECSGYGKHYSEKNSEIQDFYKVYWLAHKQTKGDNWATLPSKKEKIKKYIDKAAGSSTWVLNHLSGAVGMTPPDVARSTNAETYKYLEGRGKSKLGIIIMDFPGEKLIYRIIKSNFDFSSYCNCPPKTFRVSSHHSWAEFRLPQGTGNQTINIKGGAYNKYKFPKCNRVRWSDLEFVCNPSSCNWEKVKGDWDADANCHGSKGNSPYVFVGNK